MAYYLSAYAIAVAHGFRGSEAQWIASLKGLPGKSAYEVAVECGFIGTKEEWLETLKGEADLPIAQATAAAGTDNYAAYGENLPDVHKADEEQQLPAVGVGKQIVFVPQRANLTEAPLLTLNSGEQIEVRLRADGETADTVHVPVGALKAGVPVTLTFGGTYWLVDSAIGGLGGGNAERVELTQPVTIGETECDNVQDALEAAADALEGKIDEEDVEEVPFVTASDALQQVANDTAPITPAGVKAIVDEYGGDAQNIKVFSLDDVSYAALFAATEDAKTAIFLAYNVGNYQPDPEEEVYPYDPTLLILKMKGFTAGVGATFEQDADLVTYTEDTPPVAVNVRKTVRVSVAPGATVGAADVITVEITETGNPAPVIVEQTEGFASTDFSPAARVWSKTTTYAADDIVFRTVSPDATTKAATIFYKCNTGYTPDGTSSWSAYSSKFTELGSFVIPSLQNVTAFSQAIADGTMRLFFLGGFILHQSRHNSVDTTTDSIEFRGMFKAGLVDIVIYYAKATGDVTKILSNIYGVTG